MVVAAPNDAHVDLTRRALDAGLPVAVDKPLAPTVAGARSLVEQAERLGVLLTVFMNRRWDSDQLTLRRLLDERKLGEVLRYELRFERWRPALSERKPWREVSSPEAGGGVLLDLGSHLVDQAFVLFGPVAQVYAEVESRRGGADDDVFLALEHRAGARSHLWASLLAAAPGPRCACSEIARPTSSPRSTGKRMRSARAPGRAATRAGVSNRPTTGRLVTEERSERSPASGGTGRGSTSTRARPAGRLAGPRRSLGCGEGARGPRRRSPQRRDGRRGRRR